MKTIKNDQRHMFKEAARAVMNLIRGGEEPADAIRKIACREDLTPGFTHRLCEVINVRQTYKNFQKDAGLEARLEPTAVVDGDALVGEMFDQEPEEKHAALDPPPNFNMRPKSSPSLTKVADVDTDRTPAFDWGKVADEVMNLHSELEKAGGRVSTRMLDIPAHIEKAARAMKQADDSFDYIEERILAKRGTHYRGLFDFVAEELEPEKRAEMTKESGYVYVADHSAEPYATLHRFLDAADDVADAVQKKAELEEEFTEKVGSLFEHADEDKGLWLRIWLNTHGHAKQTENRINGNDTERELSGILGSRQRKEADSEWKNLPETARSVTHATTTAPLEATRKIKGQLFPEGLFSTIKDVFPQKEEEETEVPSVFTPEHDTQIQKVKTQALLNQFLSTDPLLRDANPEKVIDAFNEIRSLRPDLVDKPHLLHGLLRYMVQRSDVLEPSMVSEMIEQAPKSLPQGQEE